MKIYKFGGTSVGTVERMKHVAELISESTPKIVVLSATAGTTNHLEEIAANLFNREPEEEGILRQAKENGTGFIAFSPLAQGLLTNRYLNGIPEDSRIAKGGFLKKEALTEEILRKIKALNELAFHRGQTLAEMALAWVLKDNMVTSVIIGASSVGQLTDNLKAIDNTTFSAEELESIYQIVNRY